jgi:hypothetical protein
MELVLIVRWLDGATACGGACGKAFLQQKYADVQQLMAADIAPDMKL